MGETWRRPNNLFYWNQIQVWQAGFLRGLFLTSMSGPTVRTSDKRGITVLVYFITFLKTFQAWVAMDCISLWGTPLQPLKYFLGSPYCILRYMYTYISCALIISVSGKSRLCTGAQLSQISVSAWVTWSPESVPVVLVYKTQGSSRTTTSDTQGCSKVGLRHLKTSVLSL